MDLEATETAKVMRLARLGTRRLTRAHVALGRRPQVSAQAADGLSAVCERLGQQLGLSLRAQGRVVEATVLPSRSLSPHAAFALFELSTLGELCVLEVELSMLAALTGRLLGAPGAEGAAGLTRLEEAAFGFLCLQTVSALRTCAPVEQLWSPRLVWAHADRQAAQRALEGPWRWLTVQLSLEAGAVKGGARLWLPAQPLQSALEALPQRAPRALAPEVLKATVPARVRAGRTTLELAVAEQLAAGDVVLLDSLRLEQGVLTGEARLRVAASLLTGHLLPEGFRLTTAVNALPPENSMSLEPVPVDPSPVPSPLPSLCVDVEIELTRVRLSLGELSALRPGSILALRCNAAEPVTLWIGDRAVARAELVEIEGELGARILHLNP